MTWQLYLLEYNDSDDEEENDKNDRADDNDGNTVKSIFQIGVSIVDANQLQIAITCARMLK